jgi:hypothetical protein
MFKILDFFKRKLQKEKSENNSCEFDFDKSFGKVLDKRYDREGRAYDNLSKQYDNLDELPQEEYNSLIHKEIEKIHQEDEAADIRRKSLLRIIKTLRGKEEIKNAINSGQKVLKQKVEPLENIRVTDLHIKDKKTGEITIEPYSIHTLADDDSKYEIVKKATYYPYKFPPTAAYLLPDDLKIGEKVILEDLIEDIVGASHAWGTYRLDSAEAVWDGEKFIVDCDSYDVEISFG